VDIVLEDGHCLKYSEAEHEVTLGMDGWGNHVAIDDPRCIVTGHMDFGWCIDGVAYVADLKKSRHTSAEGPDSLQLLAYGFAYASKNKCESFCTGLWIGEDAEWVWSAERVVVDSTKGAELLDRVIAAASNTDPSFCTGPHCRDCYSRTFCPEHLLGAAAAETWLAPVTKGDPPVPAVALDLIGRIKATKEILDKADKQIKAWCRAGQLTITDKTGKVYGPVMSSGRRTLNEQAVKEAGVDLSPYYETGQPYEARWAFLKPKG
jgi:hypothetical protein